ncbi:metal ABC transporter substrate-binding protein [Halococcus hamelinensis]|uniref:metal ABC transporter substrate-binding protein n=1 Tax=Halococcus hamelinensis TaxID=332168 RepID=UPI0005D1DBF4
MKDYTRRRVLIGAGVAGVGGVAGCLGGSGTDNGNESGSGGNGTNNSSGTSNASDEQKTAQASFFVFGDFASQVAGDAATANTLVPVGQHGHGWEPGPQIQGTVLDSDLFVHGMKGFQPWADDLVSSLQEDNADVTVVTAGSNVDLLEAGEDHHHHEEEEEGHHHENESAGNESDHHEHHENESEDKHHGNESEGEQHDHKGEDGQHGNESEHEQHENESEGEHHNHEHNLPGGMDPHFWLDPLRAKTAVGTIEQGFTEISGGNEDAFSNNADEYRSRLDDLHGSFQSKLESASKEVVFVAGHNAYQYLAERYGFEAETLTELSPDDQPTPRDIERAQEIVGEHDLEYVLADPLESQKAANQLVAETDAKEVLPLTPIPGQTQQWANKGWGYVDIMEQVNLPTLVKALDAQ